MLSRPITPPQVDYKLLGANGKLLNDDTFTHVCQQLKEKDMGRYTKNTLGSPYGTDKRESIFVVYHPQNGEELVLGKGEYGYTKLLQEHISGTWYVQKTQILYANKDHHGTENEDKNYNENQKIFDDEYQTLFSLGKSKHPALIRKSKKSSTIKADIIMAYEPGISLRSLISLSKKKPYPELFWVSVALLAAEALQRLHQQNHIHRDIKLSNGLIDLAHRKLTWIDFGFAEKASAPDLIIQSRRYCGAENYMAPELTNAKDDTNAVYQYSPKTDIYALGKVIGYLIPKSSTLHENFIPSLTAKDPNLRPPLDNIIQQLKAHLDQDPEANKKVERIYTKAAKDEERRLARIEVHIQSQKNKPTKESERVPLLGAKSATQPNDCAHKVERRGKWCLIGLIEAALIFVLLYTLSIEVPVIGVGSVFPSALVLAPINYLFWTKLLLPLSHACLACCAPKITDQEPVALDNTLSQAVVPVSPGRNVASIYIGLNVDRQKLIHFKTPVWEIPQSRQTGKRVAPSPEEIRIEVKEEPTPRPMSSGRG